MKALSTRIHTYHLDVSDAEIQALMRKLASEGHHRNGKTLIEPELCLEVAEHLLDECRVSACRLDLRMLEKAYQAYLLHDSGMGRINWKDLIAVTVRESAASFKHEVSKVSMEEKRRQQRNGLREIMASTSETKQQLADFQEEFGCSRATFFRLKSQIASGEFDEYDGG